jgi:hypothetical protein
VHLGERSRLHPQNQHPKLSCWADTSTSTALAERTRRHAFDHTHPHQLRHALSQGEQRDMVSRLLSRISTLQCAAAAAEATRRQLHNQMVELRGNVSARAPFLASGDLGSDASIHLG